MVVSFKQPIRYRTFPDCDYCTPHNLPFYSLGNRVHTGFDTTTTTTTPIAQHPSCACTERPGGFQRSIVRLPPASSNRIPKVEVPDSFRLLLVVPFVRFRIPWFGSLAN